MKIDLDLDTCLAEGFIILDKNSPFEFARQTGGLACHYKRVNGYFVPYRLCPKIKEYLCCIYNISSKECEFVNRYILKYYSKFSFIADSGEEAWVEGYLDGKPTIMTWENCD